MTESDAAEPAQSLAQRETALDLSDAEQLRLKGALELAELHVETGETERSRLHAALASARDSAEARIRRLDALHETAEREDMACWEKALGRWKAERAALIRLLASRDMELAAAAERLQDRHAEAMEQAAQAAARLDMQATAAAARLDSERRGRDETDAALALAREQLSQIFQSRSWRVTKPLRSLTRAARRVF